jgi:hypothetical protein
MPSILIRDKHIFSSEGMLEKDYGRKGFSWKKTVVVVLNGLGAEMNWLAVNYQS